MNSAQEIFHLKNADPEKLTAYGFSKTENGFFYQTTLPFSEFLLEVTVKPDGNVYTVLMDPAFNEPYTQHLIDTASGSFVAKVREEFEKALRDISEKCFFTDVFRGGQTKELIRQIRLIYRDELEFLWEKSPDCAIWRRKDSGKWYGVLMTVPACKLGDFPNEPVEILNLHTTADKMDAIVDKNRYFPGYHMNKKYWFTVLLNGSASTEEILSHINESYRLAKK